MSSGNTLERWGARSYQHTFVAKVSGHGCSTIPLVFTFEFTVGYSAEKRRDLDPELRNDLAKKVESYVMPVVTKNLAVLLKDYKQPVQHEWVWKLACAIDKDLRREGFYLKGEFYLVRTAINADALGE